MWNLSFLFARLGFKTPLGQHLKLALASDRDSFDFPLVYSRLRNPHEPRNLLLSADVFSDLVVCHKAGYYLSVL